MSTLLTCQRDRFFLPPQSHYLNCAYMSPLSRAVEDAGIKGMRLKRTPMDIAATDFFESSDHVRRLFSSIIGADDPNRIALIPSVSYGVSICARNADLHPGNTVVVLGEQFPSNVYPWMSACQESGATLIFVDAPGQFERRGHVWNARLLEAIGPETAVVAVPQVHWTDGSWFDLENVAVKAREVGAALVVDGTQSVGALPFDIKTIQPDALICAGYKWLMGPYSMCLAYLGARYDHGTPLEEGWIVRKGSDQFSKLVDYQPEYQSGALRYDVGERSNFVLVPMMAAALEQIADWTPESIQAYCDALTEPTMSKILELGFSIEDPKYRGSHLFGIRLRKGDALDRLLELLANAAISVSVRGTAVRVAPNLYNDADDLDALVDVLGAL